MNGVLCIYKPKEFTSFDVIAKLRGILKMRRLGHTGTLDPMAEGVLLVLVGNATRACDILPNQEKAYRADLLFAMGSNTLDIWGDVCLTYPSQHVTEEQLLATLPRFTGAVSQIPPMFSAVSVDGVRLHELARKGIEVQRKRRTVQIHSIDLIAFNEKRQSATIDVSCGKGTYIRTLISDLGKTLGGDAVMTGLCRTMASGFTLEQCHTFADIEQAVADGTIESLLIPTDTLFSSYPQLHLNETQTTLYCNGVKLDLARVEGILPEQTDYAVYSSDGTFLGTAAANFETQELCIRKTFYKKA